MKKREKINMEQAKENQESISWDDYEKVIHEYVESTYSKSTVKYNQKIVGIFSKVERQIDILIEEYVAGVKVRIVIDAKYYKKKLDVKDIETFISMVEDVEASYGMLITNKGYSIAAKNRAFYGPKKIELDVLNFDELNELQGFVAIPYSGKNGIIIPAPFGWIIDSTRRDHSLATLYQRGFTLDKAAQNSELMYVNIWNGYDKINDLQKLIDLQAERVIQLHPKARISYEETIKREDGKRTIIRKIIYRAEAYPEYTGFVEFEEFCFFCVLYTHEVSILKNKRKLEFIIERVLPISIDQGDVLNAAIEQLDQRLSLAEDDSQKAYLIAQKGYKYMNHNIYELAESFFEQSMSLKSDNYDALKGQIELHFVKGFSDKIDETAIERICSLEMSHSFVEDNIAEIFYRNGQEKELVKILEKSIASNSNSYLKETLNFCLGLSHFYSGMYEKAKKNLTGCKSFFSDSLDSDYIIQTIDQILAECNAQISRDI